MASSRSKWLLVLSLAANLLAAGVVAASLWVPGFAQEMRNRFRVTSPTAARGQELRRRLFTVAPVAQPPKIVFAGDSLTEGGLWNEWLAPLTINRGVATETSADLLARAEDIAALRPERLFLMIGTNDFGQYSPEQTAAHVAQTVGRIRRQSPATRCFVQSILPNLLPSRQPTIRAANTALRQQAMVAGYEYLEIAARFLNAQGNPRPELFVDPVHLSAAGYREWLRALPEALRR